MKTIFVHIGTYKTATSSIQAVLGQDLLSHVGVHYLSAGRHGDFRKHLRLFDSIVDDSFNFERRKKVSYENIKRNIVNEINGSGDPIFVISEEELSFPSPLVAEKLQFLMELGEVQVLFVVRSQPELLDSLYRQFMKEDGRRIFCEFEEFVDDEVVRRRADFFSTANMWSDVFGIENTKVVDFDRLREKGDAVQAFFDWAGLPYADIPTLRRVNESLSAAEAEAVRQLAKANAETRRGPIVRFFESNRVELLGSSLNQDIYRNIEDRYREANRSLAEKYGVDLLAGGGNKEYLDRHEHRLRLKEDALEAVARYSGFLQEKIKGARDCMTALVQE